MDPDWPPNSADQHNSNMGMMWGAVQDRNALMIRKPLTDGQKNKKRPENRAP